MPEALRTLYYYLTFACNLRCRHCYVSDRLGDGEHAAVPLVLGRLAWAYAQGARQVVFLGGEPTLHPAYGDLLQAAGRIGYQRLVVDTNGAAGDPLPEHFDLHDRLSIRFGFESIDEEGDLLRGPGVFQQALRCLRRAVAKGVRTEVTYTLHARNAVNLDRVVDLFANEGVQELNFHFASLAGNGSTPSWLELDPAMILQVQQELAFLCRSGPIPLRYPRLLVPRGEWVAQLEEGMNCRRAHDQVLLILPQGEVYHCPLEIMGGEAKPFSAEEYRSSGCPLAWRLLPRGVPDGYRMSCISWKEGPA